MLSRQQLVTQDMAASEAAAAPNAERRPWVTRWFANPVISTALGLVGLWAPSEASLARHEESSLSLSSSSSSIEELEATSGCKVTPRKNYEDASGDEWRTEKALMAHLVDLPPPLVGKVASYWRTARDPLY